MSIKAIDTNHVHFVTIYRNQERQLTRKCDLFNTTKFQNGTPENDKKIR